MPTLWSGITTHGHCRGRGVENSRDFKDPAPGNYQPTRACKPSVPISQLRKHSNSCTLPMLTRLCTFFVAFRISLAFRQPELDARFCQIVNMRISSDL